MEWHGVNIASMTNDDNMMCGLNYLVDYLMLKLMMYGMVM
jgi:hypothetical protein